MLTAAPAFAQVLAGFADGDMEEDVEGKAVRHARDNGLIETGDVRTWGRGLGWTTRRSGVALSKRNQDGEEQREDGERKMRVHVWTCTCACAWDPGFSFAHGPPQAFIP